MEKIGQDLRFGIRMMLRSPGFTLVALVTIALGIGANTAIFSVVNTVLLRPLPYQDPDRLVVLWEKQDRIDQESPSIPDFVDWRERNQSFEQMAAARRDNVNLTGIGEPERLLARMVTANFFSTLGVNPQLGRVFTDEEEQAKTPVVLISDGLWKRRFGSDPTLVGRPVTLYDASFTVIGVLPSNFQFYTPADVFVPISFMPDRLKQAREEHGNVVAIARLKPGITAQQAEADMDGIAEGLEREYPKTNNTVRVRINSIYGDMVGDVRSSLLVLLGAVGFVLLIACANVANLLLARAAARHKEMAIRTALGASRLRVIRQMLTESVLLSVAGGALGLLVAMWGADLLLKAMPDSLPWIKEIVLDANVLGFTFAAAFLTGVVFGLAPAVQASRTDVNETLKEGGRGLTGRRQRMRSALVISEVALALVLLVGAGLMVKTFWRLGQIDAGFDPKNLLTMTFSLSPVKYSQSTQARAFYKQLEQRIGSLPGVEAAAFTHVVPLGSATVTGILLEGQAFSNYGDQNLTVQSAVGVDYFRAMGIPLLEGRTFTERDMEKTPLVAVIDENMARELFRDRNPIGQFVFLDEGKIKLEVIGVVRHIKHLSWDADAQSRVRFQMYTNYNQIPDQYFAQATGTMSLVLRGSVDPAGLIGAVRAQVAEVDKDQPIYNIRPMGELIAGSISQRRFAMMLLAAFAAVALVLATIGIYGVMSYSVTQRSHEIGIRMALGARGADVLNLVVRQGLKLVIAGVAIGLAGAFALTRLMESLLFGVSATDPLTFVVTSTLLTGVALVASFVPARRATRVDPMTALRCE
ncbi:MAG TPA: ABC transporter permease [Blastocatellia bacterium]|nr:ABC transporter permease [Blastocatellia bacterium]